MVHDNRIIFDSRADTSVIGRGWKMDSYYCSMSHGWPSGLIPQHAIFDSVTGELHDVLIVLVVHGCDFAFSVVPKCFMTLL